MAKVKFVTEVKYNGVKYPAHTVFVAADEDLASLKQSGAIVIEDATIVESIAVPAPLEAPLVEQGNTSEESEEGPAKQEEKVPVEPVADITKMTVVELKSLAKEMGVDIKGVEKKAEIIALIEESV